MWRAIEESICEALSEDFRVLDSSSIGGGCINQCFHLRGEHRSVFVKLNTAKQLDMFEAEAAGLKAINESNTIATPEVITQSADQNNSWLALGYLELTSTGVVEGQAALGEVLAGMHGSIANAFGWYRENYIGKNRQANIWTEDWPTFIREHRIGFQLEMAKRNGLRRSICDRIALLLLELHRFYDNYAPTPSLLHGDLWSGNYGLMGDAKPVVFDPAVYYGDREADIAMTELFGGFDEAFQAAYRAVWPLDPGYDTRRDLHQLYHVLNHFNLFGGAYARQALSLTNRLLAELG